MLSLSGVLCHWMKGARQRRWMTWPLQCVWIPLTPMFTTTGGRWLNPHMRDHMYIILNLYCRWFNCFMCIGCVWCCKEIDCEKVILMHVVVWFCCIWSASSMDEMMSKKSEMVLSMAYEKRNKRNSDYYNWRSGFLSSEISHHSCFFFQQNLSLDRTDDAQRDFEKCNQLNPSFSPAHVQKCYAGECDWSQYSLVQLSQPHTKDVEDFSHRSILSRVIACLSNLFKNALVECVDLTGRVIQLLLHLMMNLVYFSCLSPVSCQKSKWSNMFAQYLLCCNINCLGFVLSQSTEMQ